MSKLIAFLHDENGATALVFTMKMAQPRWNIP